MADDGPIEILARVALQARRAGGYRWAICRLPGELVDDARGVGFAADTDGHALAQVQNSQSDVRIVQTIELDESACTASIVMRADGERPTELVLEHAFGGADGAVQIDPASRMPLSIEPAAGHTGEIHFDAFSSGPDRRVKRSELVRDADNGAFPRRLIADGAPESPALFHVTVDAETKSRYRRFADIQIAAHFVKGASSAPPELEIDYRSQSADTKRLPKLDLDTSFQIVAAPDSSTPQDVVVDCWWVRLPTDQPIRVYAPRAQWRAEQVFLDIFSPPPGVIDFGRDLFRVDIQPVAPAPAPAPQPLTVIALDIGSSAIAAAIIRGVAREDEPAPQDGGPPLQHRVEPVRLGAVVDRFLDDRARKDFRNPFLFPSALLLSSDDQSGAAAAPWQVRAGLDPTQTRHVQTGEDPFGGSGAAAAARKAARCADDKGLFAGPATGRRPSPRAHEIESPAPRAAVDRVARGADRDPELRHRPSRAGADEPFVLIDPKMAICLGSQRADATGGVGQEETEIFACLIETLLVIHLPQAPRGEHDPTVLGGDWREASTEAGEGLIVLALSHPGSIGSKAVRAYDSAAQLAIERAGASAIDFHGSPHRRVVCMLVPEAIAIAQALLEAARLEDYDLFAGANTGDSPSNGPRRLIVIDIGEGTTDVAVLDARGRELVAFEPMASFALRIAGGAFRRWIAQDIATLWTRKRGAEPPPWTLGAGCDLGERIDEALRNRAFSNKAPFVRIDSGAWEIDNEARAALPAAPADPFVERRHGDKSYLFVRLDPDALTTLDAGLARLAAMISGQVARSLEDGANVAVAITGRGSRCTNVADALMRPFGAAARVDCARLLIRLGGDESTALKLAVAQGAAMVARDRALRRRMDSSAPEPGQFAMVFGTAGPDGRFERIEAIEKLDVAVGGGARTFSVTAGQDCHLARMIGQLGMDDLKTLTAGGARGADPTHREVEQAALIAVERIEIDAGVQEFTIAVDARHRATVSSSGARWASGGDRGVIHLSDEGCFV